MTDLLLHTPKTMEEVKLYSPVTLAYIGDAVYELLVRDLLLSEKNLPSHILSKKSKSFVSANAQSMIYDRIVDFLNETEQEFFKKGRNAKISTIPKNMTVAEYKKATGLETIFGYLYLCGENERIKEIFFQIIKGEEK